jgi:hypothetical protein
MTDEQHEGLVELLLGIKGKAVVSGYEHPLYSPFVQAGWKCISFRLLAMPPGGCGGAGCKGREAHRQKSHALKSSG